MRRIVQWGRRLLYPGWGWVICLTLASGAGLLWVFLGGHEGHPAAYGVYVLSAYGLTVLTAAAVRLGRNLRRRAAEVPLLVRWRGDDAFRVAVGLAVSLVINLGYAVLRVVSAVRYASFWDGALGIYYILLCAVRVYLIRRIPRDGAGDRRRELRTCRWAGCYLLAVNLALVWISVQIVRDGRGYDYPGTLIYAVAAHAFYSLALAVANGVRYRSLRGPVLTAAKAVSLTTALVSIFSLETAMLAQFRRGGGLPALDDRGHGRRRLRAGAVHCAVSRGLRRPETETTVRRERLWFTSSFWRTTPSSTRLSARTSTTAASRPRAA